CLMLIAWMTTGSMGMFIARFLKQTAPGQRFCGKDFWFMAHVLLMLLTVAATIIAFILVFSYEQDWSG
ncbi:putative ferric-chelate reductase 1 precursor, partial [Silurus asotus]